MGLFFEEEQIPGGPLVGWVSGSGDGVPDVLDPRAASTESSPAILALTEPRGYLVAYGAAGGGVALRFVPALQTPAGVAAAAPFNTPVARPSSSCALPSDCAAGWRCDLGTCVRSLAPIADLGVATTEPAGGAASAIVREVVLAPGPSGAIGVAFVQDDGVFFSTVSVGADATIDGWAPRPLDTAVSSNHVGIAYSPDGIRSDSEARGGWSIAWVVNREVRGRRVSELDGLPVDPRPLALASVASTAAQPRAVRPVRFDVAGRGRTQVLFHAPNLDDRMAGELRVVGAFCGPPTGG
jgi:hypothetical protein